jgi:hypothetical protein
LGKKLYSSTEPELVSDWADKWFELSYFINGLIWTDKPPGTTPPPTEVDELEYQRLRFWFIDHQKHFISIWAGYYNCRRRVCTKDFIIENVEEFLDTDEFIKNPFHLFYRAENLRRLAQQLELQSGVDIWEPSRNYASATMSLIILLGKIMIELIDWVDERI